MNLSTKKIIKKRFGNIKTNSDGFDISKAKYKGPSGVIKPVIQDKPWGAEVWLVFTDKYAFKILFIEPGKRFSLQKHKKKEESWYVAKGEGSLRIGERNLKIRPGLVVHIRPRTIHRIEAGRKTVELWEVSTPELDDVVRLEDDFNRI